MALHKFCRSCLFNASKCGPILLCSSKFSVQSVHLPVMCNEVLDYLSVDDDSTIIDMTFGGGGHTKLILESFPRVKIFCIDRDPVAYDKAVELSKLYPRNIVPCKAKFSELPNILSVYGVKRKSIDRILFDFGCSSMQFDSSERGFSISSNGPLDMRMDPTTGFTAADVLQHIDEEDLIKIFKVYGEEKYSKKIARAIVEARYSFSPIRTTHDLSNLISAVVSDQTRSDKLQRPSHVATKIFQALRIFVNNELNEINYGMLLASYYLKIGGRLVTLAFHSLEDRIVKRHLASNLENDTVPALKLSSHLTYYREKDIDELHDSCWDSLTKSVLTPSHEEVARNPRSRSAKLRAAVKIK